MSDAPKQVDTFAPAILQFITKAECYGGAEDGKGAIVFGFSTDGDEYSIGIHPDQVPILIAALQQCLPKADNAG